MTSATWRRATQLTSYQAVASHSRSFIFSPGDPVVETTETLDLEKGPITKKPSYRSWEAQRFLPGGSLGFAIVQGVCATAVFVGGISTALGLSAAAAATAAGPATAVYTPTGSGFQCWLSPEWVHSSTFSFFGTQNVCAGIRLLAGECVLLPERSASRNGFSSVHPNLPYF